MEFLVWFMLVILQPANVCIATQGEVWPSHPVAQEMCNAALAGGF